MCRLKCTTLSSSYNGQVNYLKTDNKTIIEMTMSKFVVRRFLKVSFLILEVPLIEKEQMFVFVRKKL